MSAFQVARVGEHARHVLLLEGCSGVGNECTRSDVASFSTKITWWQAAESPQPFVSVDFDREIGDRYCQSSSSKAVAAFRVPVNCAKGERLRRLPSASSHATRTGLRHHVCHVVVRRIRESRDLLFEETLQEPRLLIQFRAASERRTELLVPSTTLTLLLPLLAT